jgi:hypothetical protein
MLPPLPLVMSVRSRSEEGKSKLVVCPERRHDWPYKSHHHPHPTIDNGDASWTLLSDMH